MSQVIRMDHPFDDEPALNRPLPCTKRERHGSHSLSDILGGHSPYPLSVRWRMPARTDLSGKKLHEQPGHSGGVTGLFFHPDGNH